MIKNFDPRLAARTACALIALAVFSGCHWDMWDNARLKPLEDGHFFTDRQSARTLVAGVVPYGGGRTNEHLYQGKMNGQFVTTLPDGMELNAELLARGQNRFNIYCAVCHSPNGDGDGSVVRRGFPTPPSYHIPRLREAPIGYFYDVMTNGFGRMYSYAYRVPVEDRWAIAAYIRVLQLSRHATPDQLPEDVLEQARNPQPAAEVEEEHSTDEHH